MLAVIAPRSKAWTHSIPASPQHLIFCWICRFDKYTHTHTHTHFFLLLLFLLLLWWGRWLNAAQKRSMIACIVWLVVPEEAIDRAVITQTPTYCIKMLGREKEEKGEEMSVLIGAQMYWSNGHHVLKCCLIFFGSSPPLRGIRSLS